MAIRTEPHHPSGSPKPTGTLDPCLVQSAVARPKRCTSTVHPADRGRQSLTTDDSRQLQPALQPFLDSALSPYQKYRLRKGPAGLENRRWGNSSQGSNPCLSAETFCDTGRQDELSPVAPCVVGDRFRPLPRDVLPSSEGATVASCDVERHFGTPLGGNNWCNAFWQPPPYPPAILPVAIRASMTGLSRCRLAATELGRPAASSRDRGPPKAR